MGGRIEFVTGIAATGKTARLLDVYRQAMRDTLRASRPGTVLWLSPTNRACRELRDQLCDRTLPVAFPPNVLTFDAFAERLLRAAGYPASRLSAPMQRMLLRQIVNRLREKNRLKHFGPIAETSGFLDLVIALIAELKRGETWPAQFREAIEQRGIRPSDAELSEIYTEYQAILIDRKVYDAEGRFWWARDLLQSGHWGPFANLRLAVVDGFTDFTQTQQQMLALLAARIPRVIVSLPLDEHDQRRDLFSKSAEMQRLLEQALDLPVSRPASAPSGATARDADGPDVCAVPGPAAGCETRSPGHWAGLPAGIRTIAEGLFRNPRQNTPAHDAEGVSVVEAAGEAGEIAWVAARVKQWLVAGERPANIVVAIRDLDGYHDRLAEAFEAARIPYACEAAAPLSREPTVRALLNVLQLEVEDWPFRRLLGVIDSSLFSPDWPEWRDGDAARDAARVLRHSRLFEGRERMLRRLQKILDEAPAENLQRHRRVGIPAVKAALAFLKRLSRSLERLRTRHELSAWARLFGSLISELSFDDGDRGARDALAAMLDDAARGEILATGHARPRSLAELLPELLDLVGQTSLAPAVVETGRVRVLRAEQVRNLDAPCLVLAGLSERSFPRPSVDDCLYSESERQELNQHGLALGHRMRRAQEEMLLFYGIVTRARRELVLTYPVISSDGEPLSPSPYLAAVLDLFAEGALNVVREEQLDPIPRGDRLLTWADARVRGMYEALENRPPLFRAVCDDVPAGPPAWNALAAAEMHHLRFHTPGFSNYEGMLENPHNLAALARRFPAEHEYSATQLEAYSECPFRFFLSHIAGVEPVALPGVETDYGERGTLVHHVLAELHRELFSEESTEGDAPIALRLTALWQRKLAERLGQLPERSEVEAALLEIEARLLGEWGPVYATQFESYLAQQPVEGATLLPARFEIAFGRQAATAHAGEDESPPLIVGDGEHATRITGRIDRIDAATLDGRPAFVLVDYKTGKPLPFTIDDLRAGKRLQLALYTLAVCRLEKLLGPGATPVQMGYWKLRDEGFLPGLKTPGRKAAGRVEQLGAAAWESLVEILDEVVPRLTQSLRGGQFPVYNSDETCTSYCDFHTVCRVGQIRALADQLQKTWSIERP